MPMWRWCAASACSRCLASGSHWSQRMSAHPTGLLGWALHCGLLMHTCSLISATAACIAAACCLALWLAGTPLMSATWTSPGCALLPAQGSYTQRPSASAPRYPAARCCVGTPASSTAVLASSQPEQGPNAELMKAAACCRLSAYSCRVALLWHMMLSVSTLESLPAEQFLAPAQWPHRSNPSPGAPSCSARHSQHMHIFFSLVQRLRHGAPALLRGPLHLL